MNLPKCPYCQEQISFLCAFIIKSDGEFCCSKCGKTSDIKYNKSIRKHFWLATLISFVFLLLWTIFINDYIIFGVLLVLAPFINFYINVPSLMVLRKPTPRRIKKESKLEKVNLNDETKVINIKNEDKTENISNERVKVNKIEDVPIDKDLYNK